MLSSNLQTYLTTGCVHTNCKNLNHKHFTNICVGINTRQFPIKLFCTLVEKGPISDAIISNSVICLIKFKNTKI